MAWMLKSEALSTFLFGVLLFGCSCKRSQRLLLAAACLVHGDGDKGVREGASGVRGGLCLCPICRAGALACPVRVLCLPLTAWHPGGPAAVLQTYEHCLRDKGTRPEAGCSPGTLRARVDLTPPVSPLPQGLGGPGRGGRVPRKVGAACLGIRRSGRGPHTTLPQGVARKLEGRWAEAGKSHS